MPTGSKPSIPVTHTPEANDLLVHEPLALLISDAELASARRRVTRQLRAGGHARSA